MPRQREAVLDDFREAVREYPHLVWHHCLHSTRCEGTPGLADLIIIGPGGIIFRECKPHPGAHPSAAQVAWKYAILGAGGDWALWTPQSVTDGTVAEDLRRVAAVPHIVLPRLGDPIRARPGSREGEQNMANLEEFDRRMRNAPPACDLVREVHVAVPGTGAGGHPRCECGGWPV